MFEKFYRCTGWSVLRGVLTSSFFGYRIYIESDAENTAGMPCCTRIGTDKSGGMVVPNTLFSSFATLRLAIDQP